MLKLIINKLNSMDEKIQKIMKNGIVFSAVVCCISAIILLTYQLHPNPDFFYIGLSTFKLGLFFIVEFIICALAIDTIKKQIC